MTRRIRLSTATAPERYFAFAAMPTDIAAGVETWIQLFKTGDFWDPRYGDFSINGEHLERMAANFRVVSNVADPAATLSTLKTFVVEDGCPGAANA